MHGLINRSLQNFLSDSYGVEAWQAIAARAGAPAEGFEAMLNYDDALTWSVLDAAAAHLVKARATLLEDMGTYLVSHPRMHRLRRLLRFGGVGFVDFLHSLDRLPERARLAVPDLEMPVLDLEEQGNGSFQLTVRFERQGLGLVLVGLLRAMADDFGALVCLDHAVAPDGAEVIAIEVVEVRFAEGRAFALATPAP
ncbi:MAG: heme NO-binding domain-containing protein [Paracoccaceae bacterium]